MIRSISKDIVCTASGEKLEHFFTGLEGMKQRIVELRYEQAADVEVRLYLGQDRIVDVGSECEANDYLPIPVNLEVETGQVVQAGFAETAGGSQTLHLVMFVEETKG